MLAKFICLDSLLILMQQRIVAFQVVTENNHVLVGRVFQQLYTRDWFNCIQACHNESRCISYNYERSAGANGLCELSDCGVNDLCGRDKTLVYSVGFVFQQIKEGKNGDICSLGKSGSSQGPDGGSWSPYGSWSECSLSCGGGIKKRNRTCIKPVCKGNTEDVTECNMHSCDGPSAPPKFVRAVTKNTRSIGIIWNSLNLVNYTVTYKSATHPVHEKSTSMCFANLTNLGMNTNYTITVQAYNEKGHGPASVPIHVTTSDGRVFQCPLDGGRGPFKDPNSCFHYYLCYNGAALHNSCPLKGTEFKPSSNNPCNPPTEPYCHV